VASFGFTFPVFAGDDSCFDGLFRLDDEGDACVCQVDDFARAQRCAALCRVVQRVVGRWLLVSDRRAQLDGDALDGMCTIFLGVPFLVGGGMLFRTTRSILQRNR